MQNLILSGSLYLYEYDHFSENTVNGNAKSITALNVVKVQMYPITTQISSMKIIPGKTELLFSFQILVYNTTVQYTYVSSRSKILYSFPRIWTGAMSVFSLAPRCVQYQYICYQISLVAYPVCNQKYLVKLSVPSEFRVFKGIFCADNIMPDMGRGFY